MDTVDTRGLVTVYQRGHFTQFSKLTLTLLYSMKSTKVQTLGELIPLIYGMGY